MLAIECRHDFSAIDLGERNDSRFCKPEGLFNATGILLLSRLGRCMG